MLAAQNNFTLSSFRIASSSVQTDYALIVHFTHRKVIIATTSSLEKIQTIVETIRFTRLGSWDNFFKAQNNCYTSIPNMPTSPSRKSMQRDKSRALTSAAQPLLISGLSRRQNRATDQETSSTKSRVDSEKFMQ